MYNTKVKRKSGKIKKYKSRVKSKKKYRSLKNKRLKSKNYSTAAVIAVSGILGISGLYGIGYLVYKNIKENKGGNEEELIVSAIKNTKICYNKGTDIKKCLQSISGKTKDKMSKELKIIYDDISIFDENKIKNFYNQCLKEDKVDLLLNINLIEFDFM